MDIKAGVKAGALVLQAPAAQPHDHRGDQDALSELHAHRAATADFPRWTAW